MKSRLQDYRVKTYGQLKDKVLFFYCPFGIRRWQLRLPFLPIERLLKEGFYVVVYDFNTTHVTSSPQHSFSILDAVLADTTQRVMALSQQGITNISAFGTSMGTQYAMYCSAHNPEIKKVVLNLAYGDLYEHILAFPRMNFLPNSRREKFMQAAGSKEQLYKSTRKYSSLELADSFKNREVLIYLARDDQVMPFHITSKFKNALEQQGAHVTYIESGGMTHYKTAFTNHLRSKVYLDFLKT